MIQESAARLRERGPLVGWAAVLISATALAWLWVPGQDATPDSGIYIDGARHLARGQGYTRSLTSPGMQVPRAIVAWAPGFPALIAIGVRANLPPHDAAMWVLSIAYIGYAAAAYGLMLALAGDRFWHLATLVTIAFCVHPDVLHAADTIWGDLPFAALLTGISVATVAVARRKVVSATAMAAIGGALGCAFLVRYVAIYAAAGVGLALLTILLPRMTPARAARRLAAFAAAAGAPILAWIVRNLIHSGTALGSNRLQFTNLREHAVDATIGVSSALTRALLELGDGVWPWAYGLLVAVVGATLVWKGLRSGALTDPAFRAVAILASTYYLLVVCSSALHPVDPLTRQRFWIPIWPMLASLVLAPLRMRVEATGWTRVCDAVTHGATSLLVLSAIAIYGARLYHILPQADRPQGLLRLEWRQTPPMAYVRERDDPNCALVSNDPRLVTLHEDVRAVYWLPKSVEKILAVLDRYPSVCILFFTQPSALDMQKRMETDRAALSELRRRGRIRLGASDAYGELWLASPEGERASSLAPP